MTIKQTSDAVAVTRDDAITFLETAVRNWGRVHFDQDGLEDVRVELERFAARHRLASTRPMTEDVAGLVEDFTSALRLGVEDDVTIPFDLAVRIHAALSAKPEAGESARISFLEKELEGRDVRLAYLNTEVERLRERLTSIANHSKTPGMEDIVIDILQRMASDALKGTPSDGK